MQYFSRNTAAFWPAAISSDTFWPTEFSVATANALRP